jgi:HlyD family secretion protein
VAVADVVRENLSSVVSTNGKVEPVSPVSFRARFSDIRQRVYAVEGQQVKRGQLMLFALDDNGNQAQLAQARADLAAQEEALRVAKAGGHASQVAKAAADLQKAQASPDQLHRDNETLDKLVARKPRPRRIGTESADADPGRSRRSIAEKVKATLEQQAQLDQGARRAAGGTRAREVRDLEEKVASAHGAAPFDGTLYSLPIHQGRFREGGRLLAEMADLHHVRIRAFIDEPELGQIDVNQPVEILWDAHPDRVWTGGRKCSQAGGDAGHAQRGRIALLGNE